MTMAWDEGKPMPKTVAGKKAEVRQMLGIKALPGGDNGNESMGLPIKGKLVDARIDPASNGHSLRVTRKTKKDSADNSSNNSYDDSTHEDYNTVHMSADDLLKELKRHLDPHDGE